MCSKWTTPTCYASACLKHTTDGLFFVLCRFKHVDIVADGRPFTR